MTLPQIQAVCFLMKSVSFVYSASICSILFVQKKFTRIKLNISLPLKMDTFADICIPSLFVVTPMIKSSVPNKSRCISCRRGKILLRRYSLPSSHSGCFKFFII